MVSKKFIVSFLSFVLISLLIYCIGHMFTIPMFMYRYEEIDNVNGYYMQSGSILPLLIGWIISFFVGKIYIHRLKQ